MKKILSMLLLLSLAFLTGCDDSSSSGGPSAEEEAAARQASDELYSTVLYTLGEAINQEFSGVAPGIARVILNEGWEYTSNITGTSDNCLGQVTVTFNNYTPGHCTVTGTMTVNFEGSTTVLNGTITGSLTGIYLGESYDFDYDLLLSLNNLVYGITGSLGVNDESITEDTTRPKNN